MKTNWFKRNWVLVVIILLGVFVLYGIPAMVTNDSKVLYNITRYDSDLNKISDNNSITLDFSDNNKVYVVLGIPIELQPRFGGASYMFGIMGNNERMIITNNPKATPTSWKGLQEFLKDDDTDSIPYVKGEFICSNYAKMVHDNAERQGIECGVATSIVEYDDGEYTLHSWNVFPIKGRSNPIYIDCTPPLPFDGSVRYGDTEVMYDDDSKTFYMEPLFRDGKGYYYNRYYPYKVAAMTVTW